MQDLKKIRLQGKVFDFAISELVIQHRTSFQPLWTIDSWAKFLIWLSLNCGLAGDKESLEFFADSLGSPLSTRLRRLFFERILENQEIRVIADPADHQILIMSLSSGLLVTLEQAADALSEVGLLDRVVLDRKRWQVLDAVIAIPWQASENES